jgi:GT2 family glycosyltransferase
MLADCLQAVDTTLEDLAYEIIVVDNGSIDGSQAILAERFPQAQLIQNEENVGFAGANNQGMALSQGRYVLLLNSDAMLLPDSIRAMLDLAESQPDIGMVGAHLLNTDGTFQASHTPFPNLWQEFLILSGLGRTFIGPSYPSRGPDEDKGPQRTDYVEGACMLVRREAVDDVGGLDEGYFMYAEEVDWCYAMRQKDWQVWYHPAAKVIHFGGGSSQNRRPQREGDLYRSRVRFFRKHYGHRAAQLLKLQIYGFTILKAIGHGLLRLMSRGRYGRPVVSLRYLVTELRGV